MTTLLPPSELAMLRAIARTAAVLLVCLRIDFAHPGRAIADFEIADILEADKRTVQKQLRSLSAAGLMLEQREGRYVVTVAGKNTLFGGQTSLSIEDTAEISGNLEIARTKCASKKEEEEELILKTDSSSSSNLKSAQNVQIGREVSFAIHNGLTVVPEIVGLQFQDDEPVYKMACVDGSFVTAREIVSAADMLDGFQNGVVTNNLPIDAIKPEDALAWISQAFDQRERLFNPAGLVYKRLQDIEKPRANLKYRRNPTKYLPAEYLVFLKLQDPDPEPESIQADLVAEPPVERTTLAEDVALTPLWSDVLKKMRAQMPKAAFESWLRDTYPVKTHGETLIVAARNQYCRDWLESRALEDIQKCAGRDVQFVVAVETVG